MTYPANPPTAPSRFSLQTLLPITIVTTVIASVTAVLVQWKLAGNATVPASALKISSERLPEPPPSVPPWGELQKIPVVTEKPEEFIDVNSPAGEKVEWTFTGSDSAAVRQRLEKAGLGAAVVNDLLNPANCGQRGSNFVTTPTDAFILGLTAEQRSRLYRELRHEGAGEFISYPFTFPAGKLEATLANRVSEQTLGVIKRLLYPIGRADCFSDLSTAFRSITDTGERRHLLKALTRQDTLLLRAVIRPDTNVDRLIGYWSTPGRRKDLEPLLESLTRVPGGTFLDVSHLLPGFARQRLYTYPGPKVPGQRDFDCHWTCLNFFRSEPDMSFLDPSVVATTLKRDYDTVAGPTRLGDVILLTSDGDSIVHSCVYIADDVVFTKNGANPMQPWTLMTLTEMEVVYPSEEPYRKLTYRLKGQ